MHPGVEARRADERPLCGAVFDGMRYSSEQPLPSDKPKRSASGISAAAQAKSRHSYEGNARLRLPRGHELRVGSIRPHDGDIKPPHARNGIVSWLPAWYATILKLV